MSLEAVRTENSFPGRAMRFCESCEVPLGHYELASFLEMQGGTCRHCGRPLIRGEKPERQEWLSVTDVQYIFQTNFRIVRRLIDAGAMRARGGAGAQYVLVSDCEARWGRRSETDDTCCGPERDEYGRWKKVDAVVWTA